MTQGKVALVTGVSSGIGLATATLLAQRGFRVFGTSRKPSVNKEQSGTMEMLVLDVREEESVRSCIGIALEKAGRIDALVNNAGYDLIGSVEETSVQEAKELFETNFFGVLRAIQAVLPTMRQQGSGRIAIIGSVGGFLPMPYQGIYSASKHALEGYAEWLDHEVRQFGVRVSVVEPGFIRSKLAENSRLASRTLEPYAREREHVISALHESVSNGEDPAQVASVVLDALTTRVWRPRYPAGQQAKFLSRIRKFAPTAFFERGLRKRFQLNAA